LKTNGAGFNIRFSKFKSEKHIENGKPMEYPSFNIRISKFES